MTTDSTSALNLGQWIAQGVPRISECHSKLHDYESGRPRA